MVPSLSMGRWSFFDLQAGLKLAIWPRKSISHDSGIPLGNPNRTEFTLGHNVSSKAEVDAVMEQARSAGAVIVKPAHDTFWGGYAGISKILTDIFGRSPGTLS